jgi:formate dehydrogenase iron-sulfur subunit
MSKAVLVDLRRCIGCRGCQVSCKRWNDREATKTVMNTDPKLEWTNPPSLSPQTYTYVRFVKTGSDESLNWTFAKIQCNHCIEPHCVNACPTTALIKRENGPVTYRKEVCIGCGYCINACPFEVPHFDEENKVIEKCTFCSERLDEGLEPACVQACPTDTLVLMSLEEAQRKAKEAEARGLHTYGLYEVGGTSWIYISKVPFSDLQFPSHTAASPARQQVDMLTRFAGTGVLVGGALIAGMKLYAYRRERISQSKEEA